MSQQWIWMGLAAGTLALGSACDATESPVLLAQVDPNSAGAITTGQPNPGAPAGSLPPAPAGSVTEPVSTRTYGDPGTDTGGSGSGAVLPQPYTAPSSITGAAPGSATGTAPGTATGTAPGSVTGAAPGSVTGAGAVMPSNTGSLPAPGAGSTVSGSGAVLPPNTGSTAAPGVGNTVSGSGAVLPPSTGTTAPGAGTTLSPDTNTSSNSVTPLGGGSVLDGGVGR
ncbi:hypothetical protein [Corallococcus sp. CA047B]|uniref:hypothetical protein n=1 Tax=Corallococcus sp. CA047B TaxID=2316729 RepID=UPI0011C42831|nr:hypothetical protein [Corallococcus sp. CA047B]